MQQVIKIEIENYISVVNIVTRDEGGCHNNTREIPQKKWDILALFGH